MPRDEAPNRAARRARRQRPTSRKERAMRRTFKGIHPYGDRLALYFGCQSYHRAIAERRAIDPGYRDPQERRRKRQWRLAQAAKAAA